MPSSRCSVPCLSARCFVEGLAPRDAAERQLPFFGTVGFAEMGPPTARQSSTFNAFGTDHTIMLPLEHALIADGFRLICAHRPGFAGTSLKRGWADAAATADLAFHLIAARFGADLSRGVGVVGTSGGGPAALAFAARYPEQTRALVLQSPVTHPWTTTSGVGGDVWAPSFVRDAYRRTFADGTRPSPWAEVQFVGLSGLSLTRLGRKDRMTVFTGENWAQIRATDPLLFDLVFDLVTGLPFLNSDAGWAGRFLGYAHAGLISSAMLPGVINDLHALFLSQTPFADLAAIRAPILHAQDEDDELVPVVHAGYLLAGITGVPDTSRQIVRGRFAGRLIWLGPDSQAYAAERTAFLRRHLGR
jgi:pimeloyl-ACP methyl ester carboxylesterase